MSPFEVSTVPSEGSLYAIDCEASRQLADAIGIWQDLDYGALELAQLQEAIRRDPRDAVLERALWTAAVAHYARCFMQGRRFPLSRAVFDGRYAAPAGAAEQHDFLMSLADKDLRHPVSGFEQSRVGVLIVTGQHGQPRIVAAGALHARHHTRTAPGADKALRHIEALRDYVYTVVQRLHHEVEAFARQLDIEDILKAGPVTVTAPDVVDADKTRKGAAVTAIPGLG